MEITLALIFLFCLYILIKLILIITKRSVSTILVYISKFIYILLYPISLIKHTINLAYIKFWRFYLANPKVSEISIHVNDMYSEVIVKNVGEEYYFGYIDFLIYSYWKIFFNKKDKKILFKEFIAIYSKDNFLEEKDLEIIHNEYLTIHTNNTDTTISALKISLKKILFLLNSKNNSIDFDSFCRLMLKKYNFYYILEPEKYKLFLFNKDKKLSNGDLIGLTFQNDEQIIHTLINTKFGSLSNLGENSYNFFVSIGDIEEPLKSKHFNNNPITSKHFIDFDKFKINIGFDNFSYIIFVFKHSNNIFYGDSLLFKSKHNSRSVSIKIDFESVYYDGDFQFVLSNKMASSEYLNTLNHSKYFSFKTIRISTEELNEIIGLDDFTLYFHDYTHDNYHKLNSLDYWYGLTDNNSVLKHMLNSLPQTITFQNSLQYTAPQSIIDIPESETVSVYIMKDNHTGYYKIGISKQPKYREKTLLSQSPSIELMYHKEFIDRDMARVVEKTLHQRFGNKRVRGEWFDLNDYDLASVKSVLGF